MCRIRRKMTPISFFFVKMNHEVFRVFERSIKLYILHFGPIPFAINQTADLFYAHKTFDLGWQKTGPIDI